MAAEDARLGSASDSLRSVGADVTAVQVDLAIPEGVEELHRSVMATGRPVDVLVLNAGIGVGGPFTETSLEADLRLIGLNVVSVVHLAKLIVPDMAARRSGKVLVTASIAGTMPG